MRIGGGRMGGNMDQDIRWRQRFANFDRAYVLLRAALENGPDRLNALEKEGAIQRFEYTYELAWKTLKDYLEDSGKSIAPVTPRQVLKDAFAARILPDGQVWTDMVDHRNLLAHSYDAAVFAQVLKAVHARYLPALGQLHEWLQERAQP